MTNLDLKIEVPICSPRPYEARDFQEALPAPPPATVYGMLLSFCGIQGDEMGRFTGTEIGVALSEEPEVSKVLRKMRRDPSAAGSNPDGEPQFRPEYQELRTGLTMWVKVVESETSNETTLSDLLLQALRRPDSIERYGGVSLGESPFLVDSMTEVNGMPEDLLVLRPDDNGLYAMPVWTDYQDRKRTNLQRFDLKEGVLRNRDTVVIEPG